MDSDYPKAPGFSESKLKSQEVVNWAQSKNFEVVHQDKEANVVMVGEDHTDFATFTAEQELIEKVKPNYVILEGLSAGKEIENVPRFWTLAEASTALEMDAKSCAEKVLELGNQTLEKFAAEALEERRAEDRLEETDTLESVKEEYKGIFPYPENPEQLLNLPFYLWPYCIQDGFKQLCLAQTEEPLNQIGKIMGKVAPATDTRFEGGKTKAYGLIHSASKSGSRVVGMDNKEAKEKIVSVIKQANKRRYERLGIKVTSENPKADEAAIEDVLELQKLLTSVDFTPEERQVIEEQSKIRRETMAESIAQRTQDGSSAVVITGSRHIVPSETQNYIPLDEVGVKRIAIKQSPPTNSNAFSGSHYIDKLTG